MATPEGEEFLTEEEIDRLLIGKALRLCKKYNVDLTGNPELQEIKCILKLRFLSQKKTRAQVYIFSVIL